MYHLTVIATISMLPTTAYNTLYGAFMLLCFDKLIFCEIPEVSKPKRQVNAFYVYVPFPTFHFHGSLIWKRRMQNYLKYLIFSHLWQNISVYQRKEIIKNCFQ